jgi:hypothetical protein
MQRKPNSKNEGPSQKAVKKRRVIDDDSSSFDEDSESEYDGADDEYI